MRCRYLSQSLSLGNGIRTYQMALDLKKLDREIDEALAKETPESLTRWLKSKRQPMTEEQKKEITRIAIGFTKGFKGTFDKINGTGWLIVDPLSGYLNALGFKNTLWQLPETDKHPQVLIMQFEDGSQFIPSGGDLKPVHKDAHNWIWL